MGTSEWDGKVEEAYHILVDLGAEVSRLESLNNLLLKALEAAEWGEWHRTHARFARGGKHCPVCGGMDPHVGGCILAAAISRARGMG